MTTPASGEIVWRPLQVKAFAHEVATAASELREVTPLLRALAELRVPAALAPALVADLEALTRTAEELERRLERDVVDLWAAVGASAEMEGLVTAILDQAPGRGKIRPGGP